MKDLWGFSKIETADASGTPHGILQEQIKYFEKKIKDVLFIRLSNRKLNFLANDEYGLVTNFEIVAPALDGYSYILFAMYSRPESDYPVAIEKNILKDNFGFEPQFDYVCNTQEEFENNLEEILSSSETANIIRNLYSKSNF